MLLLLYTAALIEMVLLLLLVFKTTYRKFVTDSLDRFKCGHGPIVVCTLGATLMVLLTSRIYSMATFHQSSLVAGVLNITDQVLMSKYMFEASVMGYILLLYLIMDRVHYYLKSLPQLRNIIEGNNQNQSSENSQYDYVKEQNVIFVLLMRFKTEKLESKHKEKRYEVKSLEIEIKALENELVARRNVLVARRNELEARTKEVENFQEALKKYEETRIKDSEALKKYEETRIKDSEARRKEMENFLREHDQRFKENQSLWNQFT